MSGYIDDREVEQIVKCCKASVAAYKGDMMQGRLAEGYKLMPIAEDSQTCGEGGWSTWALLKDNKLAHVFHSCHCGRGCGNKDVIYDIWGYHDTEPELEAVRID